MKRTYTPPTVPLEDAEQRIIFQWAAMETAAHPELGLLYAIPNGGKRAIKTAVARNGYHGLYIELKRQKGGTVSETQKSWITALAGQGYKAVVCKGAEEAIGTIKNYLGERKA